MIALMSGVGNGGGGGGAAARRANHLPKYYKHSLIRKFKFCSGGDCPLWALAALHAAAALPAATFRRLVDAATADTEDEDRILEILKDTPLSARDEAARAAATVRWVCASARRAGCGGAALARDLHVLGAPRHHALALAQAVDAHGARHAARARADCFLVNRVSEVSAGEGPEGTVDALCLSVRTDDAFTGHLAEHSLLVPHDVAAAMLHDLKIAYAKMEELGLQ